jgi:hypothetical protein
MDINSLIAQTEALSWDDPSSQIESLTSESPTTDCLPLVGQVISQRTQNNQSVFAALSKAWEFAVPFSFAVLGPNKFLIKLSKQAFLNRIQKHVTWNVNGYLIILQVWHPQATLGELPINKALFWIQVHGLPLMNMTTIIAISIGKALGNFIKVDEGLGAASTFRSYLRLLVELDVTKPLKPGFPFCRDGGAPLQVLLKYERLDIYCVSCGKIGHKSDHCMAAPEEKFPDRYIVSLKVNIFSNILPSSSSSRNTPVIITQNTSPSYPQTLHANPQEPPKKLPVISGSCLATNLEVSSLSNPTIPTPVPKQLKIQTPITPLTGASTSLITSSINATATNPPISAGLDTPASSLSPTPTHPLSQPSNQNPSPYCSSLESNLVDSGAHLTIFLPCSPHPSPNLTFTSTTLTDSLKPPAKKHLQKSSISSKKTKPPKPIFYAEHPNKKLNLKRPRSSGELLPHKKGPGHFSLSALSPDEKEIPIPMDSTPEHTMQPPPRSFFKTSRKEKRPKTITPLLMPPAALEPEVLENDASTILGDQVVSPGCI